MNLEFELAKGLVLSVLLGLAIGVQRELSYFYENSNVRFTGARSFALISILGFFTGYFKNEFEALSVVIAAIFGLLIVSSYVVRAIKNEKNGTTTEFAAICAFASGLAVSLQNYIFAVFAVVLIVIILEIKSYLVKIRDEIRRNELRSAILFALITFVILPIIPNRPIDPYSIFNPYSIWLMVVIISGLSFAGYIAYRVIGASKGLLAIGFLGGIVSSTATTITLSKKLNDVNAQSLALAISIACTTMFVRVVLLIFAIDINLSLNLAMMFLPAALCGYAYILILYKKISHNHAMEDAITYDNPLEFKSALKLGILFGIVFGATKLLQEFFGSSGVFIFSFFSGLTDVDAIALSLAQLLSNHKLIESTATVGILIAAVANTIAKLIISFWAGGASLAKELAFVMLVPVVIASAICGFMLLA